MAYAHSKNLAGRRQDLLDHLIRVADQGGEFPHVFGGGELARLAGLLHDIGKFNPEFQQNVHAGGPSFRTRNLALQPCVTQGPTYLAPAPSRQYATQREATRSCREYIEQL